MDDESQERNRQKRSRVTSRKITCSAWDSKLQGVLLSAIIRFKCRSLRVASLPHDIDIQNLTIDRRQQ